MVYKICAADAAAQASQRHGIPAREKASTQPVTVHPLPEAVHCALVLERDGYV